MFKAVIRSIALLLLWTVLVGAIALWMSSSLIVAGGASALAVILQFWLSGVQAALLERQQFNEQDAELAQFIEQAKKGGAIVHLRCAACHNTAPVPVSYAEQTSYTCPHCGQLNKVYIQFTTARATTPLISSNGTMVPIDEEDGASPITQSSVDKLEIIKV